MAKEKDPKRLQAHELYKVNMGDITNREIARNLGVDEKKIATWKVRDNWTKKKKTVVQQNKKRSTTKVKTDVQQEININKSLEDLDKYTDFRELSEKAQLFCYHYLSTYNGAASVRRAGYETKWPDRYAYQLLQDERVKAFINKIKEEKKQLLSNSLDDVVELLRRIAFADITDFLEFDGSRVVLKKSSKVDGQLISEISETKEGAKIKLISKEKALEKLIELMQNKSDSENNKKLNDLLSEVD